VWRSAILIDNCTSDQEDFSPQARLGFRQTLGTTLGIVTEDVEITSASDLPLHVVEPGSACTEEDLSGCPLAKLRVEFDVTVPMDLRPGAPPHAAITRNVGAPCRADEANTTAAGGTAGTAFPEADHLTCVPQHLPACVPSCFDAAQFELMVDMAARKQNWVLAPPGEEEEEAAAGEGGEDAGAKAETATFLDVGEDRLPVNRLRDLRPFRFTRVATGGGLSLRHVAFRRSGGSSSKGGAESGGGSSSKGGSSKSKGGAKAGKGGAGSESEAESEVEIESPDDNSWAEPGQLLTISQLSPPVLVDFLHMRKPSVATVPGFPAPVLPSFPPPSTRGPLTVALLNTSMDAPQMTQSADNAAREDFSAINGVLWQSSIGYSVRPRWLNRTMLRELRRTCGCPPRASFWRVGDRVKKARAKSAAFGVVVRTSYQDLHGQYGWSLDHWKVPADPPEQFSPTSPPGYACPRSEVSCQCRYPNPRTPAEGRWGCAAGPLGQTKAPSGFCDGLVGTSCTAKKNSDSGYPCELRCANKTMPSWPSIPPPVLPSFKSVQHQRMIERAGERADEDAGADADADAGNSENTDDWAVATSSPTAQTQMGRTADDDARQRTRRFIQERRAFPTNGGSALRPDDMKLPRTSLPPPLPPQASPTAVESASLSVLFLDLTPKKVKKVQKGSAGGEAGGEAGSEASSKKSPNEHAANPGERHAHGLFCPSKACILSTPNAMRSGVFNGGEEVTKTSGCPNFGLYNESLSPKNIKMVARSVCPGDICPSRQCLAGLSRRYGGGGGGGVSGGDARGEAGGEAGKSAAAKILGFPNCDPKMGKHPCSSWGLPVTMVPKCVHAVDVTECASTTKPAHGDQILVKYDETNLQWHTPEQLEWAWFQRGGSNVRSWDTFDREWSWSKRQRCPGTSQPYFVKCAVCEAGLPEQQAEHVWKYLRQRKIRILENTDGFKEYAQRVAASKGGVGGSSSGSGSDSGSGSGSGSGDGDGSGDDGGNTASSTADVGIGNEVRPSTPSSPPSSSPPSLDGQRGERGNVGDAQRFAAGLPPTGTPAEVIVRRNYSENINSTLGLRGGGERALGGRPGDLWAPHVWTSAENTAMKSDAEANVKGQSKADTCTAGGNVFTGGVNGNYTGCGVGSCCARVAPDSLSHRINFLRVPVPSPAMCSVVTSFTCRQFDVTRLTWEGVVSDAVVEAALAEAVLNETGVAAEDRNVISRGPAIDASEGPRERRYAQWDRHDYRDWNRQYPDWDRLELVVRNTSWKSSFETVVAALSVNLTRTIALGQEPGSFVEQCHREEALATYDTMHIVGGAPRFADMATSPDVAGEIGGERNRKGPKNKTDCMEKGELPLVSVLPKPGAGVGGQGVAAAAAARFRSIAGKSARVDMGGGGDGRGGTAAMAYVGPPYAFTDVDFDAGRPTYPDFEATERQGVEQVADLVGGGGGGGSDWSEWWCWRRRWACWQRR
jgi:hypothetical protein